MGLEEPVLFYSPHWSSGGFPKSPAVLNKGQSSSRQCSKTCYFSSLPSSPGWNFVEEACRLKVAAIQNCEKECRMIYFPLVVQYNQNIMLKMVIECRFTLQMYFF